MFQSAAPTELLTGTLGVFQSVSEKDFHVETNLVRTNFFQSATHSVPTVRSSDRANQSYLIYVLAALNTEFRLSVCRPGYEEGDGPTFAILRSKGWEAQFMTVDELIFVLQRVPALTTFYDFDEIVSKVVRSGSRFGQSVLV